MDVTIGNDEYHITENVLVWTRRNGKRDIVIDLVDWDHTWGPWVIRGNPDWPGHERKVYLRQLITLACEDGHVVHGYHDVNLHLVPQEILDSLHEWGFAYPKENPHETK
jgi:hypothetical protein